MEEHVELLCNAYQGPPRSRSVLNTNKFLLHGFPVITETKDKTIIQQQKQIQIDELINLQNWTKLPWDADQIHQNLSSPDMKIFEDKENKTCSMIISLRKPYKLPCFLAPVARTWPQFLHLRPGRLDPQGNKIQFKHDLYLQPIPHHIENINSAGVLLCAIRGILLDRSGAVAEALINLIKQYIEGTTKANSKALTFLTMPYTTARTQRFRDKRTGQSKSQRIVYPELLLLVYVSDYHNIDTLWNSLGLPDILSHRTLILPAWRVILGRSEQVVLAARTASLDVTHTVTKIRNLIPEMDPEAVLRLLTNEGPNKTFFLKIGMIAVERGKMQSPPASTDTLLLLSDSGAIGILLTPLHQQCLAASAGASSRLVSWSGPLEGSEHQRKIWQLRSKEPLKSTDRKPSQARKTQDNEWKTVGTSKPKTTKDKTPQGTHYKDVQSTPLSKTSHAWGRVSQAELLPLLEGYSLQLRQRKTILTGPPSATSLKDFKEWTSANPDLAAQLQSLSPAQRVQLQELHYRTTHPTQPTPCAAPVQLPLANRLRGYFLRLSHAREVEAGLLTHATATEWTEWQESYPKEALAFIHCSEEARQSYARLVQPMYDNLEALVGTRVYKRMLWTGLILRAIRDSQAPGHRSLDFEEWSARNPEAAKVLAPFDSALPPTTSEEEAQARRIEAQTAYEQFVAVQQDKPRPTDSTSPSPDTAYVALTGYLLHQKREREGAMDEVLHSTEMVWQDWTRANPTLQHHFTSGPRNPMDEAQRNETFAIWDAQAEEVNHYLRPLSVHCDDTMLLIITKGILLRALAHSQELAQAIPPLCDPASLPAWESLHPEAADALNQLGDPNEVDPDMNDEDFDQGKI